MNRRIALQAIFLISAFCIISFGAFPVEVMAQQPEQAWVKENSNRTNASFTTLDTLDSSDFIRQSGPAAATTGRRVKNSTAKKETPAVSARRIEPELIVTGGRPAEPEVSEFSEISLPSTGNSEIDALVASAAAKYGLDPHLIFAVMRQESGFKSRAVSPKGASGLMQLMPATARRLGVQNIFDPAQNIDGGARYLRFLLDNFDGDVELALAGYNAGEGAVARYGNRVPPYRETMNYVQRISAHYTRLKSTASGRSRRLVETHSESLQTAELVRGVRTLSEY